MCSAFEWISATPQVDITTISITVVCPHPVTSHWPLARKEHGSVDEDAASEEDVPAGWLVSSTETTPPVTTYDVPFNPITATATWKGAHSCTGDLFQGHRIVGMSLHLPA